jgi:hypothetical protein
MSAIRPSISASMPSTCSPVGGPGAAPRWLIGVDRNTIGRWLAAYERGGLPALLAIYIPAGKRKPLSADQLTQLRHALA